MNPAIVAHWSDDQRKVPKLTLILLLALGCILTPIFTVIEEVKWWTVAMATFNTSGKQWVVDKMQDVAPNSNSKMEFIASGTGTNAEAVGDSALQTESSEGAVLSTLSQPSADTDRAVGTITYTGSKSISECNRRNQSAASGAIQLMRCVFTAIPVLNQDRIEFTEDLQVT